MKILHFVPYLQLFPPVNGGALRSFNIAKELSKKYEVDIFLLQNKNEIDDEELEGFGKINIFSPENKLLSGSAVSKTTKIINTLKYRILTRQYFNSAETGFLSLLPVLKKVLKQNKYDIIVFEHLQSMITAPFFRRYLPDAYFILDAHNVDHLLIAEENAANPISGFNAIYKRIKKYECSLAKFVDGYWACSQRDGDILNQLNKSALTWAVIPNGVDTKEKYFMPAPANGDKLALIFCGDLNTVANHSGIIWFIDNIWPLLQKKYGIILTLTIIGGGDEKPQFDKYKTINGISFRGRIENLASAYQQSTISIAPLLVGSGTRLKILESLSFGIPVVATQKAAEGVLYKDGEEIMLADDPIMFYNKIIDLYENKKLYQQMRIAGRRFVELYYDWNVIGEKMVAFVSGAKHKV